MSNSKYIEMVYNEVEGVISFIFGNITVEYKRFNDGKKLDEKSLQQIFFEYLYANQGKLVVFHEFIDNQVKKYPSLSKSRDNNTRNILQNIFDFTINPWIKLFFPIKTEYNYKFKNKITFEELEEKEFHNIIVKRPTRKR